LAARRYLYEKDQSDGRKVSPLPKKLLPTSSKKLSGFMSKSHLMIEGDGLETILKGGEDGLPLLIGELS